MMVQNQQQERVGGRDPEPPEEIRRRFGAWLTRQIDARKWSGRELARRMGVRSVDRWIRGEAIPGSENLEVLSPTLGVPRWEMYRQLERVCLVGISELSPAYRDLFHQIVNGTDAQFERARAIYRESPRGESATESERDALCRLLDEASPERVSMALAALRAMLATEMRARIENGQ
jgi:transcriptional regulator with XRE-family HTH domain